MMGRCLGQGALAEVVGMNFAYISKIENEKLDLVKYRSEDLILQLAGAMGCDEDELLVLAEKVPARICRSIFGQWHRMAKGGKQMEDDTCRGERC
jgi:transcriptional regulator with XRE-family HTH domain